MATVLAKDPLQKGEGAESTASLEGIPPLGVPKEEKRFFFQRDKYYDPFAIATQVWACIMFMALELDRANISQANTDNMLGDLKMTTNDFNLGNTVFKLAFLCAELPSQLVSKWVGPDRWIPAQMVLWSIVASCQFWLSGRDSFLACRALLGLLQGGFIPDVILYLSYFYKHHELSLRLGFFWTAMSIADILSALLAYGLLHMRGLQGHAGWRWLFLIEGLLTLVIGIFGFLLMPAGPCQTASWFRGKKGWFTEREEAILVNRVLREDPSKSSMHNREPITPRLLWDSLRDYDLWPLYILGLTFQIPSTPPQQYLTLTLRNLGFDTFQANLLSIPNTVGHMITMLAITYLAEVFKELTFIAMSGQFWTLPFLIYLNVVDTTEVNRWVLYTVISLLLIYPNAHPIQVGWNSRNSNTVRSRTVSAACYNMFVQTSGIISSNIYRSDDAPLYKRGNRALLGIVCMNLVLYPLVKAYYVYRNKRRDKIWDGMSEEQRLAYLATTKDEGNKRLDFRFSH
ncbi:putative transporter [Colletotrichum fructicola]|nr:putative transporter [Colletotrichum fructicola]KAE9573149.1 putative transporter [Colletotrichum fructicola]KAF4882537.1 putative transporter [Colletotrichum fructicola]KAF4899222.1 putative transporter [Colletotrichum fructicola]KAF4930231.1 putative transporter [Colletotrichum fructicola]KAF5496148.1 putative transporter [Colletotrichum fructicola]